MIKITFKVPDMTCANCAMSLEGLEDSLAGIHRVDASYHRLEMIVEFDETRLAVGEIIEAVRKKGYTAMVLK